MEPIGHRSLKSRWQRCLDCRRASDRRPTSCCCWRGGSLSSVVQPVWFNTLRIWPRDTYLAIVEQYRNRDSQQCYTLLMHTVRRACGCLYVLLSCTWCCRNVSCNPSPAVSASTPSGTWAASRYSRHPPPVLASVLDFFRGVLSVAVGPKYTSCRKPVDLFPQSPCPLRAGVQPLEAAGEGAVCHQLQGTCYI